MRNVNMSLFENAVKNCSEHKFEVSSRYIKYSSAHVRQHNPCTGLHSTKYNCCSNKDVCHYKIFFPYAFTPHGNIDWMNQNCNEYRMLKVQCTVTNAPNVLSIDNTRPNKVRITTSVQKITFYIIWLIPVHRSLPAHSDSESSYRFPMRYVKCSL